MLVQSKVNLMYNLLCEYELAVKDNKNGSYSWIIVKKAENISIKMKHITSIAFDPKNFEMVFIRDRCAEPKENYELFALNIRRNLDPRF